MDGEAVVLGGWVGGMEKAGNSVHARQLQRLKRAWASLEEGRWRTRHIGCLPARHWEGLPEISLGK